MILSGLLSLIDEIPSYRRLLQDLKSKEDETRAIILDSAKPYLIACLHHALDRPMLIITARSERARQLFNEIPLWAGNDIAAQFFPEPDALPYERLSSDLYTAQQRIRVLSSLCKAAEKPLIVSSFYAIALKTVAASDFYSSCQSLNKGSKVNLEHLLTRWIEIGYEMDNHVDTPGTISKRGGIIDIYPPDSDFPARIELFGNEVESIRLFNPSTQRSIDTINSLTIVPAREMVRPAAGLQDILHQLDLTALTSENIVRIEDDIQHLTDGRWFDGQDFYSPLFNNGNFLDYLPKQTLIILDNPDLIESSAEELHVSAGELYRVQIEQGILPANLPVPYFDWTETLHHLDIFDNRLFLQQWIHGNNQYQIDFCPAPDYSDHLPDFLDDSNVMSSSTSRLIVVSQQASRLSEMLKDHNIFTSPITDILDLPPPGSITLVHGSLAEGWMIDQTYRSTVLSDIEIFGFVKKRRSLLKRPVRHEIALSELSPGDYVVHIDHGIGMFSGLTRMNLGNGEREYLILDYAVSDKLYVPTEQIDRISQYIGPGGYTPNLNRLGTQEWNRAKQRATEAANKLAGELLALYSSREISNGFAFSSDTLWQQELEASFPYVETIDQLRAVQDVKRDMEKARPMDRLICGDVGYGKTEVALRAAFKAIMDGMQVAMLVPTTVLVQQHLATFKERLNAFPVKIDSLSRFRTPKEQNGVLNDLLTGNIDMCIGTHRLLQKDVVFKNLGLVIIDEEQRFGVAHKEKLKQLRREVDVLTLSATPIPRTLHMSLIGIRDMSTMETPPDERLPIKSYVAPYNERLIREAILRELERNGQVFYVHNRVQKISGIVMKLQELVPEAVIAVGHGQMPEDVLESVMLDFTDRKIDVLVCTTIIESGLDLPNANTLIVDDADKLGLTQLYQLRGRVGRGANRAYAYFLFNKGKYLTPAAEKRLKTIFEVTELGSGFRIAMKDLEIRGAGNLLGPEQSGHMVSVGFELYCRLLSDAVAKLKAEVQGMPLPVITTSVDLPLSAYIPENYIYDTDTRLSLYLRLSKIEAQEDIDEIHEEISDRFGPPPVQIMNLLYLIDIKLKGTKACIREISSERDQIVIKLSQGIMVDKSATGRLFGSDLKVGANQLRIDAKKPGKQWRKVLEEVLEHLYQSK